MKQYQYMADFGTCAIGWPLLDEWEADILAGRMPKFDELSEERPLKKPAPSKRKKKMP